MFSQRHDRHDINSIFDERNSSCAVSLAAVPRHVVLFYIVAVFFFFIYIRFTRKIPLNVILLLYAKILISFEWFTYSVLWLYTLPACCGNFLVLFVAVGLNIAKVVSLYFLFDFKLEKNNHPSSLIRSNLQFHIRMPV